MIYEIIIYLEIMLIDKNYQMIILIVKLHVNW